jgi:hypothetical protein
MGHKTTRPYSKTGKRLKVKQMTKSADKTKTQEGTFTVNFG